MMKRGRKAKTDFVLYAQKILDQKKRGLELRKFRKKTYVGAELHIRKLKEFFADRKLEDIGDEAWMDYCAWRRGRNPDCRLFDDRKHLNTILYSAYREGLIDRRPKLSVMDEKRAAGRELADDEVGRIYQHAGPNLTLQINICLLMGLRNGEMLSLRWDRIDWKERTIRLRPEDTKTKRGRVVPIHSMVYDTLRARYNQSKSPFVFPGMDPIKIGHEPAVRYDKHQVTNAMPWRRCRRRARVKARWHDLRYTCASRMLRRGNSPHVVARVLGMGIQLLLGLYAQVSLDDSRRAVEEPSQLPHIPQAQ